MSFKYISDNQIQGVLLKLDKDVDREAELRQYLDINSRNKIDRKEAILNLYDRLQRYEDHFQEKVLGDRLTLKNISEKVDHSPVESTNRQTTGLKEKKLKSKEDISLEDFE